MHKQSSGTLYIPQYFDSPLSPVVGLCGGVVVLVSLTHHHQVVAAAERVRVHLDGVEVGVRVGALRLISGAPVVVPYRQLGNILGLTLQSLSLGSEVLARPAHPDVEGLHTGALLQAQVLVQHSLGIVHEHHLLR